MGNNKKSSSKPVVRIFGRKPVYFKPIIATVVFISSVMITATGCNTSDNYLASLPISSEIKDEFVEEEAFISENFIPAKIETISIVPEYKGAAYTIVNNNVPSFSDTEKASTDAFEYYSDLDSKGRCGVAFANICKETMPTGERGTIGMIKPSGWKTVKYNGLIDGNYLYNRCHLIGWQLVGENANEKNLITGTRYLNVEGMLPFEDRVADYVKSKENHVLYRVTPKYEEDNLVASGVQIEAWSVEDGGAGICFNVFCYNVQPGIMIDYATGESELDETTPQISSGSESAQSGEFQVADNSANVPSAADAAYILNTNTKKFHYPYCSSTTDIKPKNRVESNQSRDEIIEAGYVPCKRCNP